jgi:hypothetical protein
MKHFGFNNFILEGTKTISGNVFIPSKRHLVIGLKMMICSTMMSNNYTCLKGTPCLYQKPKEKVVVFFLCRQDNKSHWQSPDGIKAFTQNFFASHVTID